MHQQIKDIHGQSLAPTTVKIKTLAASIQGILRGTDGAAIHLLNFNSGHSGMFVVDPLLRPVCYTAISVNFDEVEIAAYKA